MQKQLKKEESKNEEEKKEVVQNQEERKTSEMLMSKPVGADQDTIARWVNTKRKSLQVARKVWQKLEGDLSMFDEKVATYQEWEEGLWQHKGLRNSSG